MAEWLDNFIVLALLGGIGVALVAGPLGSFVVWRKMAYFGDALAHSGLLGVALGLLLQIHPVLGLVVTTLSISLLLFAMEKQNLLPTDTLLGILSHAALSIGLITLGFMDWVTLDLTSLLFGDLLALTAIDLIEIYTVTIIGLAVLYRIWRPLLLLTLSKDLAEAEGIHVTRTQLLFLIIMSISISVAMKVVGVLLITSLLIIPAASARHLSKSPEQMAMLASGIGVLSVMGGLGLSFWWDTASGPSIVVTACLLFIMAALTGRLRAA